MAVREHLNWRSIGDTVRAPGVMVGQRLIRIEVQEVSDELKGLLYGQGSGVPFTEMATWLKMGAGVQVGRTVVSQEPVAPVDRKCEPGVSS